MAKLSELRDSTSVATCVARSGAENDKKSKRINTLDQLAPLTRNAARHPLDSASILSCATLHWIQPLLRRGYNVPIQENDVWMLPVDDQLQSLRPQFESVWNKPTSDKNTHLGDAQRLARALVHCARKPLRVATVVYTASAALALLQPLLIKALLLQLSLDPSTTTKHSLLSNPYVVAGILGLTSFCGATAFNFGLFQSVRSGSNARLVLLHAVYQRLVRLRSSSSSIGDVLTLTSVDCERVLDAFAIGLWLVLSPLMLLALCWLIGVQLGYEVGLTAAATVVLIVLLVLATSRSMGLCRQRIAQASSRRVQLMSETLQGIRLLKCYGWEGVCQSRIDAVRVEEVEYLRRYAAMRVYNSVIVSLAPLIVNAVCFAVVGLLGRDTLDVATAFAVVALSNAIKTPLSIFGDAAIAMSEAKTALQRLSGFLLEPCVDATAASVEDASPEDRDAVLTIKDADFQWASENEGPRATALQEISLTIRKAQLTVIVGGVGSGKTTLSNAILGQMDLAKGSRVMNPRATVAFASQEPWLQHTTLRDNILFGEPFDEAIYDSVLDACQLRVDVSALEAGDATEIGERGSNLSGGQRARVVLARAIYRVSVRADAASLLVMDDPLSALDVHVANSVFHNVIMDFAKSHARVLVLNTHYHLLQHADRVIVMDNGRIIAVGTFHEVCHLIPSLDSSAQEPPPSQRTPTHRQPPHDATLTPTQEKLMPTSKPLMVEEDRAKGSLGVGVYLQYVGFCGWNAVVTMVSVITLFLVSQVALFLCDWMLSQWTKPDSKFSPHTALGIYIGLVATAVLLVLLRSRWFTEICIRCSSNLHSRFLRKVLLAPVPTFFDVTPLGRILNRFSRDLDNVDGPLPYVSLWALVYVFQIGAALIVCTATNPSILILFVPLVAVFRLVARFFQRSARELKRLDGVTRSPFVNLVSETLQGLPTIQIHDVASQLQAKCEQILNHNASFSLAYQGSMWWFAMRTDWLVATIIMAVAMLCSFMRDSAGSAMAALALTYAAQLTSAFQRATVLATQTENVMTNFERIAHYEGLRSEETRQLTDPASLDAETTYVPVDGAIVFQDVSLRYRPELELVLQNVSFSVKNGEKVGVCGRTGSGKSSLMSLLFRVVETTSGRVCIDGVDIATLPLQALRAKLTIIPQDPMLFSGSLRLNLDPFHEKDDAELWNVLRKVHLYDVVQKWGQGLEYEVAEKGDNLSVGQRQLLCIARALIRQSKVVVMDEATANVDQESDKLIQLTVRESFAGHDTTVLCIAHRLETIIHSDKILVLDAGRVLEYDSPEALMKKKDGIFQSLVKSSRVERSQTEVYTVLYTK